MLINSRVSLLFLFVGSFMGIWSQDQQPSIDTVIAEARQIKQDTMLAQDTEGVDSYEPRREVTLTSTKGAPATESPSLDLDASISTGFYRAVNHKGDVKLIHVLETAENRDSSKRDFYIQESADQRWYLIRLSGHDIATHDFQTVH